MAASFQLAESLPNLKSPGANSPAGSHWCYDEAKGLFNAGFSD
jgi:hypothetical protein